MVVGSVSDVMGFKTFEMVSVYGYSIHHISLLNAYFHVCSYGMRVGFGLLRCFLIHNLVG